MDLLSSEKSKKSDLQIAVQCIHKHPKKQSRANCKCYAYTVEPRYNDMPRGQ